MRGTRGRVGWGWASAAVFGVVFGTSLSCRTATQITVTVTGKGAGGRCQELGLAAALELDGAPGVVVLAAGTDGTDGPTPAAGAIVDGESARRARAAGDDPERRLADNDSHAVLARSGDLVTTGPTSTTLLDLYLVLVE